MRISDWSSDVCSSDLSPPASEDRDIDVLDDRGSRNIRHMRIFMLKLRVTFIRSVVLILTIQAHPAVALFLISRAQGRNVNLTGIRKRRGGACHFDHPATENDSGRRSIASRERTSTRLNSRH